MKEEKENLYAGKGVIRVHSGTYINLQDIDVDQIKIEDIAHALSNICRWGGHCENFYSVAEHCIHVVMLMEYQNEINTDVQYSKRDLLAALLHDATEAYLVDMPSPIKSLLPDFQRLEKGVESIIKTRFGIESFDHVKEWDKVSLEMEWKLDRAGHLKGAKPKQAKKRFLKVYERLTTIEYDCQTDNTIFDDRHYDLDKNKSFDSIVKNLSKLAIKDAGLISTGNDLARELNKLEDSYRESNKQEDDLEFIGGYPSELTKEQSYQCTVEEIADDYQRREKLLGEIMAADERDGLYEKPVSSEMLATWSHQLKEWELEFEKGRQEVEDHIKMKWAKVGNSHIGRVFGFDIKFIVEQDEIYFYASEVRDCDAGRFDNLEEAKQWCREEALRLIKIKQK